MSRILRRISILALTLVAIAILAYLVRNPEKTTLDATARAGAAGKFVTLSQGVTHYDISGPDTGRAVVLAHGASVPYYIWDSTAIALSNAGYRVIRYDRFGFGLSDRPDAQYDSTMFTRQINDLADSLKLTKFDLMGLSFGGFVTAHYIASHADRVRTLTLLDPVAVGRRFPWYMKLPVVHDWFMQTLVVPTAADGQPGDFLHPEKFPGWADRFRPQTAYRGIGRAMYRTGIATAGADYEAMYKAVGKTGIPVLLVWGRQDPVVAFTNADMVRSAIPQAEFLPVDSAGHLPAMEQSTLVKAKMLEFLSAHSGARP
ncbi:MAG: alpha/beta hydrolase [Gemmatimonadaceae bacterium]